MISSWSMKMSHENLEKETGNCCAADAECLVVDSTSVVGMQYQQDLHQILPRRQSVGIDLHCGQDDEADTEDRTGVGGYSDCTAVESDRRLRPNQSQLLAIEQTKKDCNQTKKEVQERWQ